MTKFVALLYYFILSYIQLAFNKGAHRMTINKDRDYFFDNARAILIFLVVLGHMIQPYTSESKYILALYLVIYSFHMPTFLFISGYFAKHLDKPNYLENVAKNCLHLTLFLCIFSIYYFITGKVMPYKWIHSILYLLYGSY